MDLVSKEDKYQLREREKKKKKATIKSRKIPHCKALGWLPVLSF
jgi:hypothetical protein